MVIRSIMQHLGRRIVQCIACWKLLNAFLGQDTISCYVCKSNALASHWFDNERAQISSDLDELLHEGCVTSSNLNECPPGVKTCGLSITEERFRVKDLPQGTGDKYRGRTKYDGTHI